jgi:integration host factor subunit alpha
MVNLLPSINRKSLLQYKPPSFFSEFTPVTLTKDHIIGSIQSQLNVPKSESSRLVESLLEIIKATLANGEDVLISQFGKFIVKRKAARRGRNPATGEDLTLDARRVITFKCSALLRDRINGKG